MRTFESYRNNGKERQPARTEALSVLWPSAERSLAQNKPEGTLRNARMLGWEIACIATRYTRIRSGMEHAPQALKMSKLNLVSPDMTPDRQT